MKTTLEALNTKLAAAEDYRVEGEEYHASFTQSESIRTNELQVHIVTTAKRLQVDTAEHTKAH